MSMAARLRLAFAAFVALLALSLLYHAYTIRRAAASARALTEITARSRMVASEQAARLAEMRVVVGQYTRSRDVAHLDRVIALTRDYSHGLRRLDSLRIAAEEREVAAATRAARRSTVVALITTTLALGLAILLSRALLGAIEDVARVKREFISNVSHDLKTPLASMQETSAVLLDEVPGPLNARQRQLLMLSQEGGRRLQAMIGKLLTLARLEAAPSPSFAVADLVDIARSVARRVNDPAVARGAHPRVRVHAGSLRYLARVDADGLAHVLDNLIENALKFSPGDTRVEVRVGLRNGALEVRVADQGCGVPDDRKERVFERFYQSGGGPSARSDGVGLGLAICHHVVTAHGGTLHVRDNIPRGAVFIVSLPATLLTVRDRVRDEVELAGLVVDRERHVPLVVGGERHFDDASQ